jgi:hypothetical protein
MLKWSKPDLTEFFGAAPTYYDAPHSYGFEVTRDGLRLLITIFDLEGAVYVSIFRDGLPKPLVTVNRELCSHAHITQDAHFRPCFEAGATKLPVTDMGIPPVLSRGVRVYVEPQFQIQLIQPRFEDD